MEAELKKSGLGVVVAQGDAPAHRHMRGNET